jgi:hypothetical protein
MKSVNAAGLESHMLIPTVFKLLIIFAAFSVLGILARTQNPFVRLATMETGAQIDAGRCIHPNACWIFKSNVGH